MRDPLGNKISSGTRRDSGHAGTNIPYAPEESDNRGTSEFPRILLKRIPGMQSFRRVASSNNRFKKCEQCSIINCEQCSDFLNLLYIRK